MPRQNRVTPFSAIVADPARGTLMGNRGCLHDDRQNIRRQFQGERWIICLLEFKGRKRTVMTPGHYTELFFLDEATALAAGHRPCAECQRERFTQFRALWASANPGLAGTPRPAATVLDLALHQERTATQRRRTATAASIERLPDGVLVTDDEHNAYLVRAGQLVRWSMAGYERATAGIQSPARILTPPSVVRTLAAGYPVGIDPSALAAVSAPSSFD